MTETSSSQNVVFRRAWGDGNVKYKNFIFVNLILFTTYPLLQVGNLVKQQAIGLIATVTLFKEHRAVVSILQSEWLERLKLDACFPW
jgi:hypothetical protein